MKGVVEGQCGQQNALVGLANTFGTSNQRVAPSSAASSSLLPSSSLGEQMASEFLRQQANTMAPASFSMKSMQQNLPQTSASSSMAMKWSQEFQPRQNQLAAQWSQQYTRTGLESAWRQASPALQGPVVAGQKTLTDSGMWSSEYLDTVDTSLQSSAGTAGRWADDFLGQQDNFGMENTWNDPGFEQRWEEIKRDMESEQERTGDYIYQESNPFTAMADPLSEGDNLMSRGDIGNAMLAYEAAVQKDPQDAKAWCRLGLAHAENEKDQLAMQAFKRCLEIDAGNKDALLALSVSQANEGMENEALHQLDKWMSSYTGNNATQVTSTPPVYSSFLDNDTFNRVEARFLDAARQQGATPDPDLQNALGVLYNLNRNFARAVDCMKLAISRNPSDARLWNRLGATLANGDRTAEAISAYREALNLYPTYVRARYNLGISCMQLSSYDEALKHFVSALELQKGGNDASSIWSTMRSAAIRTADAPESLLRAVEVRDLAAVKATLAGNK